MGGTAALASLTTDAAGETALNGGAVTTTGAQTYNDAVTLGANATLTSTGGGNLTFGSTLNGPFALAAHTAGAPVFQGVVGGTLPPEEAAAQVQQAYDDLVAEGYTYP